MRAFASVTPAPEPSPPAVVLAEHMPCPGRETSFIDLEITIPGLGSGLGSFQPHACVELPAKCQRAPKPARGRVQDASRAIQAASASFSIMYAPPPRHRTHVPPTVTTDPLANGPDADRRTTLYGRSAPHVAPSASTTASTTADLAEKERQRVLLRCVSLPGSAAEFAQLGGFGHCHEKGFSGERWHRCRAHKALKIACC